MRGGERSKGKRRKERIEERGKERRREKKGRKREEKGLILAYCLFYPFSRSCEG